MVKNVIIHFGQHEMYKSYILKMLRDKNLNQIPINRKGHIKGPKN